MILEEIVAKKKITLEKNSYKFDVCKLSEYIKKDKTASFYNALKKDGLSIIGEVKKASPSRGIIKEDFNPIEIAKQYETAVDAVSVLTEENFFMGSSEYLEQIHNEIKLPLLRKDFIISPMQIFEARFLGASAVLLIAAVLNEKRILKDFIDIAHGAGLDALVETHNLEEVELALGAGAKIIGINNRNLHNFSENTATTENLAKHIPDDIVVVSESSIHTADDIKVIKRAGVDAVLVGESFMVSDDILKKAEEFRNAYGAKN